MRPIVLIVTLALAVAVTVQQCGASAFQHAQHHHKVHQDGGVVQSAREHQLKYNDDAFVCPTESGYFEHPNCLKFWQCGNWIAYEMDCAPGTQWNQTLLTCDHLTTCQGEGGEEEPGNDNETTAPPGGNEPEPTTPQEPGNPEPTGEPGEGFTCPSRYGYFPHKDCWKFWQCGNWIAYEMTCAPGTQWSQELLTCDHITTCQRPAEPTEVPEEPTTEAPEEPTTAAPEEPTEAPEQPTTAAPEEPTEAPVEPTEQPTEAPEQPTTAAPEEPTGEPGDFTCPSRYGYFPHKDCWKFWQCGNWIAYEMTCAPGTQWSQELLTCDHITTCQRPPENPEPTTVAPEEPTEAPEEPTTAVPEEPTEAPEQPTTAAPEEPTEAPEEPTTAAPEEPTEAPEEPTTAAPEEPTGEPGFNCPHQYGYYPHKDCWKFWQCGNWISYEMTCAPGTQWNQDILTCDHITTCKRPPANPEPTTAAPEEPTTAAPEEPTEAPEEPTTAAPEEPTAAPEEPTEAPEEPTTPAAEEPEPTNEPGDGFTCPSRYGYFPHKDCWKFWQCGNWIAYEMTCAPGTQWEQSLLTCVHLSTCQRPTEPTEAPEEPTEAPEEPTEAPVEPTQAPEEPTEAPVEPTEAPEEPTEAPVEPTEAPEEPTEAPEEPTDAPEEPTDAPVEPTEAPEEPTEAPEQPTTAAPEEPTGEPGEGFTCPSRYGYFPHKDCWKFWQCGNWIAYEMTCAPGTQWNQTLLTCDHLTTCQRPAEPTEAPEEPTTEASEEPGNDNPTTAPPEQPGNDDTTTAAPEEPEQPVTSAPFECPSRYGYFPHQDCWKFWQCGNWIAYEMTCAPGTQWSQELLTCDHLTTCNRPADPPQNPPEEPVTSPPTEAPTAPPADDEPAGDGEFKCPTTYGYFAHKDCWKFWQCGNGIAYEQTCPPFTQWHQSILNCAGLTSSCKRPGLFPFKA